MKDRIIATIPAVTGEDIDVPDGLAYWLPGNVLRIDTPGAQTS
jgi:hypothetical protein